MTRADARAGLQSREGGDREPLGVITRALLALIRVYQRLLSPLLGDVCRFYPSCSRYAATCLERFGVVRGSALAAWRLCRCHPFHPGGVDLPPERAVPGESP